MRTLVSQRFVVLRFITIFICLPFHLFAQNGAAKLAGCAEPAKLADGLKAVLELPWTGISVERVIQIWPTGLPGDWCQHQANCILLHNDGRVIENETECGESFRFDTSQLPESEAWQKANLESVAMKYMTRTALERDSVERILVNSVVRGRKVEEGRGVRTGVTGWVRVLSWTDQQPEVRSCDLDVQHQHVRTKWLVMFSVECKPGK
jgi:hypothetical protein